MTSVHANFFKRHVHEGRVLPLPVTGFCRECRAGLYYRSAAYRSAAVSQVIETMRGAWCGVASCETAGIEDFRQHDLRRMAATDLVRNGGTVRDVMDLLGV